jgi:hypothetical protein
MNFQEIKSKAAEAMTIRVLIYLIVGSGGGGVAFAWGADIWDTVGRSKDNATQISSMTTAMKAHNEAEEKQLAQIQQDLRYLKMLTGIAQVRTSGDEMSAAVNTKSLALRFRPGQEVWVTNYTDPGDVRIKVKIEERSFRDDADILMRLSKRAGEALEVTENEIDVGIEPVIVEEKKDD